MKQTIKVAIIPDVHGRDFWVEPVNDLLKNTRAEIVFLGDYHDPYPDEWDRSNYRELSIERFKQIIQLKKEHPKRITLLIGNHDCGYCIGEHVCSCRKDYANERTLEHLFNDNRKLFQIAKEVNINHKHFILSHAGILKGWVEQVWGKDYMNKEWFNVVNELNNAWLDNHYGVLDALANYDSFRGWSAYKYGSPVWSDIRSWINVKPEDTYGFNIVGHTMLNEYPVILETIADIDCQKVFYIDSIGALRDYLTDDIIKEF